MALIHGATLHDRCFVGLGSVAMDGCEIEFRRHVGGRSALDARKDYSQRAVVGRASGKVHARSDFGRTDRQWVGRCSLSGAWIAASTGPPRLRLHRAEPGLGAHQTRQTVAPADDIDGGSVDISDLSRWAAGQGKSRPLIDRREGRARQTRRHLITARFGVKPLPMHAICYNDAVATIQVRPGSSEQPVLSRYGAIHVRIFQK